MMDVGIDDHFQQNPFVTVNQLVEREPGPS